MNAWAHDLIAACLRATEAMRRLAAALPDNTEGR